MPVKLTEEKARAIMEASDFEPIGTYPGSVSPWKSKCLRCGEVVKPRLNAVKAGKRQCGYCSKSRVQEINAQKVLEKAYATPITSFPGGNKPWKSTCNLCKRIIFPTYANIRNNHKACAYCSGKKIDPQSAIEIMKLNNLIPLEEFKSSKSKWKSLCRICEVIVYPRYGDIKQGQGGCLKCGFKKASDQNRLSEQRAVQRMFDMGLQPLEKYTNIDAKWKCLCLNCNNVVFPSLHSATGGQGGCIYCGRKKAAKSKRNSDSKVVKIMHDSGFEPLEDYPGAALKWKCIHKLCGRITYPRFSQIYNGGGGCRECGYSTAADKHRIPQEKALRIMVDAGLQPIEKYVSSTTRWKSIHLACGRKVSPQLYKIQQGQGGCKYCGIGGLDFNKPAFIYLMTHSDFQSHKIGIGNASSNKNRITEHKKMGWSLFKKKDYETGQIAFEIEQESLIWMRNSLKLPFHLCPELMPQGGWTETVNALEIDLPTIWAKVEELSKVKR
jgi:hypothetical protein